MNVTVTYRAQAKQATGASSEVVRLADPCTVGELVAQLAKRHGEALRLLLDASGKVQPALLLFIGDEQVGPEAPLAEGNVVTVLTPMAGG